MQLQSGTLLQGGRYKIIEKIGQGGFGIVYKALHIGLQRNICIKEFFYGDFCERAENSSNITVVSKTIDKINLVESFRKKFIKEAQRLATFQSPSIVNVMDTFEENNTAYYVMEHIDGGSLENFIESSGALSESKTIEIVLPILDALNALHSKGLLHLDIKPANIMLRKDLTPVLIDFGISKYIEFADGHTTTAPVGISKGYAPLEQYGGNISDFTKATDIYSACATLYRMVTGQIPPEPMQVFQEGLKAPYELQPNLSAEFSAAIVKGLSIKTEERFQSASQLKTTLLKTNNESTKVSEITSNTQLSKTNTEFTRVSVIPTSTQIAPNFSNETVTDIDGNIYQIVRIGIQEWMIENLKTTRYRNGDLIGTTIPSTKDISEEHNPKYQWAYEGIESNVEKFGRLYTWHVVDDERGIAPLGWRVPSNAD